MKTAFRSIVICLFVCFTQLWPSAAEFASGSNESFGPLIVTNRTILLAPPDGIFHCTAITIRTNGFLAFNRNEFNTPIYLLATGDVVIEGTIDVSGAWGGIAVAGAGGPGGFDGGMPGVQGSSPGDGEGPGGGKAGSLTFFDASSARSGAYASITQFSSQNTYGNSLLQPLIGGSGGGGKPGDPGMGGGGGGGAILIASSTRITHSGMVRSQGGGSGYFNGASPISYGSGGAIRLVAPVVRGSGTNDVSGDPYKVQNTGVGGLGRIRIDTIDRFGVGFDNVGRATIGAEMVALPAVIPRLSIIEVAGNIIPEGTAVTVRLQLPPNAPAAQTIKLQARDFTGLVPATVVVYPENGSSTTYTGTIDMASGNPAQTTIDINIPAGVVNRIKAWTR